MIEERLINSLQNKGYRIMNSNVQGNYLIYQAYEEEVIIVSVFRASTREEVTVEQYKHVITQIKAVYAKMGYKKIHLLNLIFSCNPNRMKQLCLEEDEHWIVDSNLNQLIIYENQSADFFGLRGELERAIDEERYGDTLSDRPGFNSAYNDQSYGEQVQHTKHHRIRIFTLINTIIIGINIVAYLIMHHTGLFGGTNQMIKLGGAFWYSIFEKGEYYRLLTSIFMHSNIGHLFNNMLVLLFVGDNLERAAGKFKYLVIYFGSGIIADITSIVYNMIKDKQGNEIIAVYSIGASGAVFGVVGAMLYIILVNKGRLEDISSRQMILFIIFGFYGGITNAGIDNAAHIGGFIAGLIFGMLLYRRPKKISKLQQE